MYKKITYILLIFLFVASCNAVDSVKRGLTGEKAKAADEYKVAVKNGVTHDKIVKYLNAYQKTLRPDFEGVHLFRWLKDERWEEQEAVKQDTYKPTVLVDWSPFEEEL